MGGCSLSSLDKDRGMQILLLLSQDWVAVVCWCLYIYKTDIHSGIVFQQTAEKKRKWLVVFSQECCGLYVLCVRKQRGPGTG